MVKKFQRSSADHELRIPHLLRTVGALYRTISYMQDHIMEKHLCQLSVYAGGGGMEKDKLTALFVSTCVRAMQFISDYSMRSSVLSVLMHSVCPSYFFSLPISLQLTPKHAHTLSSLPLSHTHTIFLSLSLTPTISQVYLFVWDRYRMVAKDFTLQVNYIRNNVISLSSK